MYRQQAYPGGRNGYEQRNGSGNYRRVNNTSGGGGDRGPKLSSSYASRQGGQGAYQRRDVMPPGERRRPVQYDDLIDDDGDQRKRFSQRRQDYNDVDRGNMDTDDYYDRSNGIRMSGSVENNGRRVYRSSNGISPQPPIKRGYYGDNRPIRNRESSRTDDILAEDDDYETPGLDDRRYQRSSGRYGQRQDSVLERLGGREGDIRNEIGGRKRSYRDDGDDNRAYYAPSGGAPSCSICCFDNLREASLRAHQNGAVHLRRVMMCRRGCVYCGIRAFANFDEYMEHQRSTGHSANAQAMDSRRRPLVTASSSMRFASTRSRLIVNRARVAVSTRRIVDRYATDSDNRRSRREFDDAPSRKKSSASPAKSRENRASSSELHGGNSAQRNKARNGHDESMRSHKTPSLPDHVPEYEADVAYAIDYIQPIKGLYCRLCKKFFTTEKAALELHAKSQAHYTTFKRTVEAELKRKQEQETEQEHEGGYKPESVSPNDGETRDGPQSEQGNVADVNRDEKPAIISQTAETLLSDGQAQPPIIDPSAYEDEN